MRQARAASVAVALALLVRGAAAQAGAAADETLVAGPLAQALDAHLARSVPFGFSGSVLVVEKGAPILVKGYGVADRTSGALCTPATIFDVGELSQPLTACAVLVLEQQKKLKTKDALSQYLRDVPEDKQKIQLQHLLVQTSGLPRTIPGLGPEIAERDELIRSALQVPLWDTPGADHVASDVGYALLAAVVEIVTEQPFEQALRELVLEPAGLASTGFRRDGKLSAARAARSVARTDEPLPDGASSRRFPAEPEPSPESVLATEGSYSWKQRGASGVLSTVQDLWRFEEALRGTTLLTKDSKKKLLTPALNDMAYGWYVSKGERKSVVHARSGFAGGFGAEWSSCPGEGAFLVVLANVPSVARVIAEDVRALVAGKTLAPPPLTSAVPEAELAALSGEYEAAGGARWRVFAHDGALFLEARTPSAFALAAGKLGGDQKHLLEEAEEIVAELGRGEFAHLHELDGLSRFGGVESWWRELISARGALRTATLLGLRRSADEVNHIVVQLELERGEELLDLRCSDEYPFEFDTGPPFASRLRFVPQDTTRFVSYDLAGRRQLAAARVGENGALELELPGGKVSATRR